MPPSAREALERALVESHERFYAFVRGRVADPDMAQDLLQESILKAIRASETLRQADSIVPWFYRILRNTITDSYRERGRAGTAVAIDVAEEIEADTEEFRALCLCFERLLPSLRPEYASTIRRLDLEQVPVDVEAARLGTTPNNRKVRRHRARQALKRELQQVCRVCADHHCVDCTCQGA